MSMNKLWGRRCAVCFYDGIGSATWLLAIVVTVAAGGRLAAQDATVVCDYGYKYYGYDDCIRLCNDHVAVVLCPAAGGRVLEYSLDGKNVLYLPAGNEGWTSEGARSGRGPMDAGRFDIGPEQVVKRGLVLWSGRWKGEVTDEGTARLTSQADPESGVRLIREFTLDAKTSKLSCTQTIVNVSDVPVSLCHWSRTFAVGGGIAVVPRSPRGRFPAGYVMYGADRTVLMRPDQPNIRVTDDMVIVKAAPDFPKLGFDSHSGWLGYFAPNDLLFVKRFRTYPDRSYNEVLGLTISVWYPDRPMVELEPIGPAENLGPGQRASFTEEWWLAKAEFPADPDSLERTAIQSLVEGFTSPPAE